MKGEIIIIGVRERIRGRVGRRVRVRGLRVIEKRKRRERGRIMRS